MAFKVGIIVNPLGGRNRRQGAALLSMARLLFDPVREVEGPRDIKSALEDFAAKGVDLLVISGGDGTVQAALTVIFRERPFDSPPRLAVLPGGTTNLIAKDVGVQGSQQRAIKRLHEFVGNSSRKGVPAAGLRPVKRPVMRLRAPGIREEFGMFLGSAGICRAVKFFQDRVRKRGLGGRAAILISALSLFWNHVSGPGEKAQGNGTSVRIDGRPLPERDLFIVLSTTLERLFLGLRPFVSEPAGCMHIVAVRSRPSRIFSVLSALLLKRTCERFSPDYGYYSVNADKMEIHSREGVALDGQVFTLVESGQPFVLDCRGEISFVRW